MKIEEIMEYEKKPLFRFFLRRIGFKSFEEYIELFGKDYDKREETIIRFRETYSNLYDKNEEKGKTY